MAKKYETHGEVCAEMRSFGDVPPPRFAWRDLADRAEAAYKREIAAKDKKCRFLDKRIKGYVEIIVDKHEEVAERDALIKELADALTNYMDGEWCGCATWSEREEVNNRQKGYRALVAKARSEQLNNPHKLAGAK